MMMKWFPDRRQAVRLALLAAAVQAVLAFGIASDKMFRKSADSGILTDVGLYCDVGRRVVAGEVPYRGFFIEYPPLALPFLILPSLFTSTFHAYKIAFALQMLLLSALMLQMIAAQVEDREGPDRVAPRLLWALAVLVPLGRMIPTRVDLVPTLLAFAGACWWLGAGKGGRGGVLIGLGFLAKIFPGAVAVPGLVWDLKHRRERHVPGVLACGITAAVGLGLWFLLGRDNATAMFRYHSQRGLELGTLWSGATLLVERALGLPEAVAFGHGSYNLTSAAASRLARLSSLATLAGMAIVMLRSARADRSQGVSAAGLAILTLVLTSKVLSPQYLIWCVPFVLVLEGRAGDRVRGLYVAASVVTLVIYVLFPALIRMSWPSIVLLNLRNGLLVAAWIVWFASLRPARRGAGAPAGHPDATQAEPALA